MDRHLSSHRIDPSNTLHGVFSRMPSNIRVAGMIAGPINDTRQYGPISVHSPFDTYDPDQL